MKTIAEEWIRYAAILPPMVSGTQHQETRRAFYAGVAAALKMSWDIGGEDVTEEEGIATMEAWIAECERFSQDVLNGRA